MKAAQRITPAALGLALAASFVPNLPAAQPDPVLDAMQAELKRSMTLTLNQLDKPYFLSYTVDDEHTWSAAATLGGLLSSNNNRRCNSLAGMPLVSRFSRDFPSNASRMVA